jgi:hypothetical protein
LTTIRKRILTRRSADRQDRPLDLQNFGPRLPGLFATTHYLAYRFDKCII